MAVEREEQAAGHPPKSPAEVIMLHPKPFEVPTVKSFRWPTDWRETVAIVLLCVAIIASTVMFR